MTDKWESFKYDDVDPWLGTGAQFDHFPLQDRDGNPATGFYWFYPCEKGVDSPFQIRIAGGPGMCCLTYAFDDPNPLIIDEQNFCFTKNPNALTKDFNILLFECPTGSGYSEISTPILKEFGEHQKIIAQTFRYLIKKFPTLATQKIFFTGESHSGKSIPVIVETLTEYENFGLTIEGLIQESPIFDCVTSLQAQPDTLKSFGCFDDQPPGAYEKMKSLYEANTERLLAGEISSSDFNHWEWFWDKCFEKIPIGNDDFKFAWNPMNLNEKLRGYGDIFSKFSKVQGLVGSEKFGILTNRQKSKDSFDMISDPNVVIERTEYLQNSSGLVNNAFAKKIPVLILVGDGDTSSSVIAIEENIRNGFEFDGKEKFMASYWEPATDRRAEREGGLLKCVRFKNSGHIIWATDEKEMMECTREFLGKFMN